MKRERTNTCISSPTSSIPINGSPMDHNGLKSQSDLRQEKPVSRFPLVICSEVLSKLFRGVLGKRSWNYEARNCNCLSHFVTAMPRILMDVFGPMNPSLVILLTNKNSLPLTVIAYLGALRCINKIQSGVPKKMTKFLHVLLESQISKLL